MKTVIDIVNDAILDVCANPLVENGTFDPNNNEHMFLLMETLDGNLEEEHIVKAVSALKCEGKYPDRQAYNKEGWLVTFPSKEYKDAAIKRGTHSSSDPTHGKGGMNLYYKKRGKQRRTAQQQPSSADADQQTSPQAVPSSPPPQAASAQPPAEKTSVEKPEVQKEKPSTLPQTSQEKTPATEPDSEEKQDVADEPMSDTEIQNLKVNIAKQKPSGEKASQTASNQTVVQPPKDKVEVTEKFAKSKGWNSTPFGEWRDSAGNAMAVVSLSGEVTPIKSNDRDELKLFAEKQK